MMTPYDKLKSLPNAKDYLKPGVSFEEMLDKLARQISDNQAADQLQKGPPGSSSKPFMVGL